MNLPVENFKTIVQLGNFKGDVEWIKFMAITCSTISKVNWIEFVFLKNNNYSFK